MVLLKSLDFGFNGYPVPANARAPRSVRKRRSFEKKNEKRKMWAFDLLATIAENLLLEREGSPTSNKKSVHPDDSDKCVVVQNSVKAEFPYEENPVKVETRDEEDHYKDSPSPRDDTLCGFDSLITKVDCSDGFDAQKLVNGKPENEKMGFPISGSSESGAVNKTVKEFTSSNRTPIVDPEGTVVVSLGSSNETPMCGESVSHGSRADVHLVSRDDDENSFRCIHPSQTKKSYRPVPHIGDRRIKKILASKYWKGTRRSRDLACTSAFLKPSYCNKRSYDKCIRAERNYPIKKRKSFDHVLESNSDGGISREGVKGDGYCSLSKMQKANGTTPLIKCQNAPFVSRDSHVKLMIKSFTVPELFVEIPETATIGSLKRTVMEAVTAVLGGRLRVGLLLQGKKVRDDSKTLLQTGISLDTHSDSLGFCLEPIPSKVRQPICPVVSPCVPSCDTPHPVNRFPLIHGMSNLPARDALPEGQLAHTGNLMESDYDSAPSPVNCLSADESTADESRALFPVPTVSPKALTTVVTSSRKPKGPEDGQRRNRCPFSVAEVEALVQAVEKLGTGRWRDVKLQAFYNAKHRTYVDLKDKWKTLVHTARISPQQRRGEPVPQELLDRVLTAHAYWSQQAVKQKNLEPEALLLV